MMSSRVTSPAVPPYSSTTMAMWKRSRCISRSSSATRLVSGTKWAGRASSATVPLLVPVALGPHEVLGVDDADDVVDALAAGGDAAVAVEDDDLHGVGHPEVGGDRDHVGAGHHDLAHDGVAQLDHRLDERAAPPPR